MIVTGIICEYNPLHKGHQKQLNAIRSRFGADCGIVCLMSGNFVQRGAPAILDKARRAEAALRCGADLVLELPVTAALSSAEGFAAAGVGILASFCDVLSFGAESAEPTPLLDAAKVLLKPDFSEALRSQLEKGLSFPAARQAALEQLGVNGELVAKPNNILAVEYCKEILKLESPMQILPIPRMGDYHDLLPDHQEPSATALRQLLLTGQDWIPYVPAEAAGCLEGAVLHTLAAGERAILARLRCMTDAEFEALPYGSEGLWRKLMHESRRQATLEDILTAVKSKRYTRTRLDRMVMCAFLGITAEQMGRKAPYVRVLGLNDRGRTILKKARQEGCFINAGERQDSPWQLLEDRCRTLYGLFAQGLPDAAADATAERLVYLKNY